MGILFFLVTVLFLLTEFFVFLSKLFWLEKERGFLFDILRLALVSNLANFRGVGSLYFRLGTEWILPGSFGAIVFCFWGKVLDCLENREILCGHRLKFSNVATVQVCRILRFFLEFSILTNWDNLWRFLYPCSSIYLYKIFLSDLIVLSAKVAFVSRIVE